MGARKLNPDMPSDELRLHMGELTPDEVLVARAAIRWANSQIYGEWKTIDTAPRDGTEILVYSKKWGVFSACIPKNMAHYKRTEVSMPSGGRVVTHWMPLPDAPTNSKEGI